MIKALNSLAHYFSWLKVKKIYIDGLHSTAVKGEKVIDSDIDCFVTLAAEELRKTHLVDYSKTKRTFHPPDYKTSSSPIWASRWK